MRTSFALNSVEVCQSLEFKSFNLKDIPFLYEFFRRYPTQSCDYSIGGIYLWIDLFRYKYAYYSDTLFIMGCDIEDPFFYKPIGALSTDEGYETILEYCRDNNIFPRIISAESVSADLDINKLNPRDYKREWMEYVYPIEKFIGFPGKKMEKKRNHLNYFLNNFKDFKIIPLAEDYYDWIKRFTREFEDLHTSDKTFTYETNEALNVIKNFSKFPFFGFAIKIGDSIVGYTYGEVIGDTLFAHVEKGDFKVRGIYQALASFLCKYAKNKYPGLKYVNREDDMGYEYLRQSKMSYHPSGYILKRYVHI